MTTLVLIHTHIGGTGNVGKRVRILALDGRNAELAGGLSSNPILFGPWRTTVSKKKILQMPRPNL